MDGTGTPLLSKISESMTRIHFPFTFRPTCRAGWTIRLLCLFSILLIPTTPGYSFGWMNMYYGASRLSKYEIFRICGDNLTGEYDLDGVRLLDCLEWARVTSGDIPLEDISEVVYEWDVGEIESLRNGKPCFGNAFANWVVEHRDNEIVDFLLFTWTTQEIRDVHDSLGQGNGVVIDGETLALRNVVETAREHSEGRLSDRYVEEALTTLLACERPSDCVRVWEEFEELFNDNGVRDIAVRNVAEAYESIGEAEKAAKLSCSMKTINHKGIFLYKDDVFRSRSKVCPDDPWLFAYLQREFCYLTGYESIKYESYDDPHNEFDFNMGLHNYEIIYEEVKAAAERGKGREIAKWHYACAFLAELSGEVEFALSEIDKAYRLARDEETRDAARVMRMFLKARHAEGYSQDYENDLYRDLVWTDGRIEHYLDLTGREDWKQAYLGWEADGDPHEDPHAACYRSLGDGLYWEEAMRKVLMEQVYYTCTASGYHTRALQYLNMAENRIYKSFGPIEKNRGGDFFDILNEVDVKYLRNFVYRMENPVSPLDSFLVKNGYSEAQYYNEIIGTRLMEEMRYEEAATYLAKCEPEFLCSKAKGTGAEPLKLCDEFYLALEKADSLAYTPPVEEGTERDIRFKLHFAQRMRTLERRIAAGGEPNSRAEAMLEFAYWLMASNGCDGFPNCWVLTRYWETYDLPLDERFYENGLAVKKKVKRMVEEAFGMFNDEDRKKEAQSRWQSLLVWCN